jgi:signal transduction histidine kinase
MRLKYFPEYPHLGGDIPLSVSQALANLPLVSVQSLQTRSYAGQQIRITGSVIFTDPIYLQDSTGGVILQTTNPDSLNIGDKVELAGQSVSSGLSPVFAASRIHLLRDRTSISPASITATEAASGAHSGTLVEVTGIVHKRLGLADGSVFLELVDPAQKFAALLKDDLFKNPSQHWPEGSTIRVRGVCTMNPEAAFGHSFTILVASASDVSVIAGPPWWSGWRLMRTVGLVVLAGLGCVYIFLRFERSKHQAVLREREQLAHEMHDTLAQSLAGVGYYLQSIRRSLRTVPQMPGRVIDEFDVACQMVTETHREASASIAAWHPDRSHDDDLLAQLERATFSMLGGRRIPIALCRQGDLRRLSPTIADVLFQVGREAISNILRHSQATSISLGLRFQSKRVMLTIEDNGVGFDLNVRGGGFGFQSMRRRCLTIGADLSVRSGPGGGCTIAIDAPLRIRIPFMKRLLAAVGRTVHRDHSSSKRTSPC